MTSKDFIDDIALDIEDKRSSFWEGVAQKVADMRGVELTDDIRSEVRDASDDCAVHRGKEDRKH